jgi:hypothetical protein
VATTDWMKGRRPQAQRWNRKRVRRNGRVPCGLLLDLGSPTGARRRRPAAAAATATASLSWSEQNP